MTERPIAAESIEQRTDMVELIMPASESMLMLTRLTVAGLLANRSRDFDMLEDMKSAAAEACYCILQQPCAYGRIRLCFAFEGDDMLMSVCGIEPGAQTAVPEQGDKYSQVALCILESMVDSVSIEANDGVIEGFALRKTIA